MVNMLPGTQVEKPMWRTSAWKDKDKSLRHRPSSAVNLF